MSTEFESRVCEIAATFNTLICVFVHECNRFYAMAQHFHVPDHDFCLSVVYRVVSKYTSILRVDGDVKKSTFGGWKDFNTHTRDQSSSHTHYRFSHNICRAQPMQHY